MNWTGVTEERVRSAVGGDVVAITELLTYARRPLCEYLERKIPPRFRGVIGADDIVQSACLDAFRNITKFEMRGEDSFSRWMRTIALLALRKAIRKQKTLKRGGAYRAVPVEGGGVEDSASCLLNIMHVHEHTPSTSIAGHERVEAVQAALEHLVVDQRRAVQLVYLEGRRVAEAATLMNKTERAVYNLCDRAKQNLQDLLGARSRFFSSAE